MNATNMDTTDYLRQKGNQLFRLLGDLLMCRPPAKKRGKKTLLIEKPIYQCDENGKSIKKLVLLDAYVIYYDISHTYIKYLSRCLPISNIDNKGYEISKYEDFGWWNNKKARNVHITKYDKNNLLEDIKIFDEGKKITKYGVEERGSYEESIIYDKEGVETYRRKKIFLNKRIHPEHTFFEDLYENLWEVVGEFYPNGGDPLGAYCRKFFWEYDELYYEGDLRVQIHNSYDQYRYVYKYNKEGKLIELWKFYLEYCGDPDKTIYIYNNQGYCIKLIEYSVDIETLEETKRTEENFTYDCNGNIIVNTITKWNSWGDFHKVITYRYSESLSGEVLMSNTFEDGMLRDTFVKRDEYTQWDHYYEGNLHSRELCFNDTKIDKEDTFIKVQSQKYPTFIETRKRGDLELYKQEIYIYKGSWLLKILPPEEDFIDDTLFTESADVNESITLPDL